MMCGCSLTPGGLWDAGKVEVTAMIYKDGQSAGELELSYAGRESQFDAQFKPSGKGTYTIIVYAFDPTTSNTGLDSTTFVIE
jgi:hypothetical protein